MDRTERITEALDALVDEGYLPGYAFAVRDADGVHEGRGGMADLATGRPVSATTTFRIASLAKLIGAIVTLQQVEAGRLELDDRIVRWIPELQDATGPDSSAVTPPITVRHLLTMTSGWGVLYSPDDAQAPALSRLGIAPSASGPAVSSQEFLTRLVQVPLAAQPGEAWRYHTSAEVLSILLERVSGSTNEDLVRAGIVEPLGLQALSFTDPPDVARCYAASAGRFLDLDAGAGSFQSFGSGLVTRPADYLRVLDEVASEHPTILRPESARAIRTVQINDVQRRSAGRMLEPWSSYGWQVAVTVEDTPARGLAGTFGWSGGTGCVAAADPRSGLSAVYLGNRAMGSPEAQREFDVLWDAVYGVTN